MLSLKEIDAHINDLLLKLQLLQHPQEGFRTQVTQPQSHGSNVWMEEMNNVFVPANIMLPLTLIKHETSRLILRTEFNYTLRNRNKWGLWHYFYSPTAPYFIPFETDTNSLLSYVAEKLKEPPITKEHFYRQQATEGYFNLWFLPNPNLLISSPFQFISIAADRIKASRYNAFKNKVVHKHDAEFSVTCNVLLYLGENKNTLLATNKLMNDIRSEKHIELTYYPYLTIAYYLFARALFYGNITSFTLVKNELIEKLEDALQMEAGLNTQALYTLAATTLLFYAEEDRRTDIAVEKAIANLSKSDAPFAFYCSNLKTDVNPATGLPNAYFGSHALTIAFHLEFLNLLRFRLYGSFY